MHRQSLSGMNKHAPRMGWWPHGQSRVGRRHDMVIFETFKPGALVSGEAWLGWYEIARAVRGRVTQLVTTVFISYPLPT